MIGLYEPRPSPLHRAPAGAKLLGLAGVLVLLVALSSWQMIMVGLAVLLIAYAAAGFGPADAVRQVWPLRWIVLVAGAVQVLLAGWIPAVLTQGGLVLAVGLAALVTLTTPMAELLDALERAARPLRLVRVRPERVALLLSLTIRIIPVIEGLASEVGDARRARGLERSPRGFVVPVVIRTIGTAGLLGDALVARGADD